MEVINSKVVSFSTTTQVLGQEHVNSIIKLRRIVLANLKHKDNYVMEQDEESFIRNNLGGYGASIGFYHKNELIAYTSITYDIISSGVWNEYKLLINPNHSVKYFGALAATLVHPDFQGQGIQLRAINLRLLLAKERKIKYLGVSVSPHNNESINNLIKAGGEIRNLTSFSDNRKRFLLVFDVNKTNTDNRVTEIYVPLRRILLHKKILSEGYYGVNIVKTGFDYYISYVKNNCHI